MKQETLEEAADTYAKKQYGNSCGAREERKICKEDFIAGAKEQQERSYSEEDMKQAYLDGCKIKLTNIYHLEKWFEQFKKK